MLLAGNYDHVLVVFRCGSDERDSAYVDLLDDFFFCGILRDVLLERIQVHDDQVYTRNAESFFFRCVGLLVPAVENASHYAWMEGLDPSAEDRRVSGDVLNCCNRNVMGFQILLGTTCGEYLNIETNQFICNV